VREDGIRKRCDGRVMFKTKDVADLLQFLVHLRGYIHSVPLPDPLLLTVRSECTPLLKPIVASFLFSLS
jgi:hypothetical protein